jgi:hypothetical protein
MSILRYGYAFGCRLEIPFAHVRSFGFGQAASVNSFEYSVAVSHLWFVETTKARKVVKVGTIIIGECVPLRGENKSRTTRVHRGKPITARVAISNINYEQIIQFDWFHLL